MYAIIDLETTGHRGSGNRITEIAIIIHDGEKVIKDYQTLVNPECRIPPFIQTLTGIDDDMVKDAPRFFEVAKEVQRLTEGMIFVAHNVAFDYNTLRKEYLSLGFDYKRERLCTVRLARKVFPGLPSYSLGNICAYMDIDIAARHRAMGDAAATAILFRRILDSDEDGHVDKALNRRRKRAFIPPDIDLDIIEALPERAGIYYFKDAKGKVIYVGKAKNIKERVIGHFHSHEKKERLMHPHIRKVEHYETGNELIALLFENSEIKRLYPRYNQAQKSRASHWSLFSYADQRGILRIGFAQSKQVKRPIMRFYSVTRCRAFLDTLVETFELCPAYCQLQSQHGSCFQHRLDACRGICVGKEDADVYNARVEQALESMDGLQGSFILPTAGRHEGEHGYVYVEHGLYQGFGYLQRPIDMSDQDMLRQHLTLQSDDADAQRIIRAYLRQPLEKPISLTKPLPAKGQSVLSLF